MRAPKVTIPLGRMVGKGRDHQRPATAGAASWLIYARGASSSGWLRRPQFLLSELQGDEELNSWVLNAFNEEDSQIVSSQILLPRSYSCNFCRREFRSAQALGGHMNVHRRDRARLHQSTPSLNHAIPSNPNQTIDAPQLLASPTTHSTALCLVYPMLPTLSASSSLVAVDTPASSSYSHVISSGNRIRKPSHNHPCPHNYSSSPSLVLTQDKTRFYHCMGSESPKEKLHTEPYFTCLEVEGSRQSDALDLELRLGQSNANKASF